MASVTVAYEFPQLQVMDLAAKASETGGGKLTHQTPEQARMNLILGYRVLKSGRSVFPFGLEDAIAFCDNPCHQAGTLNDHASKPDLGLIAPS
jgi:hypothetical protein